MPSMPEINIDLNGVLKLLSKLYPGKAAGSDLNKPIVLKELRVEIAPVILSAVWQITSNWSTACKMD